MREKIDIMGVKKTLTTRELAEVLGVTPRTIQHTVGKFSLAKELSRVKIRGQEAFVFTEEQATLIKQEIQKHHNLKTRQIDSVSTKLEENQTIANAMMILQRRSEELKRRKAMKA